MNRVNALTTELKVKYCISEAQVERHIKLSCARFKERIEPVLQDRTEPIAITCSGPSFKHTWEKVKDFKHIMSCGGTYRFLMDKGIEPEFHVDCDPLEVQVHWLGTEISPKTTFYLSSSCHPKLFDFLVEHKAKIVLWHTNCSGRPELPASYPRGEWYLNGGSNVGLRSVVLARFIGFVDMHIFGMDGSFAKDGMVHIEEYFDCKIDRIIAELNGKDYITSMDYLHGARGLINELRDLPDVKTTFYGEGLIQDMVKVCM